LRQFQPAVSCFGLLTRIVLWNLDPDVFTDALVLLTNRRRDARSLSRCTIAGSITSFPVSFCSSILPSVLARRGYRALKDHGESIFTIA